MINQRMYELGSEPSAIRELFAYGQARKAEIGEDNVFDFSIGNPSSPPPKAFQQALIDLYGKLAVAEQEIASGAQGEDFLAVARQLRERVHGTV